MKNNMSKVKTPMGELSPEIRTHNFDEVALGYNEDEAVIEAARCLNCPSHPCMQACPVGVKIPQFISLIKERKISEAFYAIKADNVLPAICGRVCPQEKQCEGSCVRAKNGESVTIGRLERFAADYAREKGIDNSKTVIKSNGIKIAVVGSGPSALSCAGMLANDGFEVTIFEALHKAGGVLSFGIPEFRLPKDIVTHEIDNLLSKGVKIEYNTVVGRTVTIDELFEEGYAACFVGSGAGTPMFMDIPGVNAPGVFSANEYLTRINLMKANRGEYDTPAIESKKLAVIGGGNVAMDAARCAVRMGADVTIIYRRSEAELPARAEEAEHAKQEGVKFLYLTNPTKVNTDESGKVASLTCIKMELGEPDASGRRRPVEIEGSEYDIEFDTVIMALGTSPNPLIRQTTKGLETDRKGCFVTTDGVTTSKEGVFAGGDAVTGAATVILAMGAGKQAAEKIIEFIGKNK